jgi:uncharacterized membrane protein/thiol-disulfide isomerase/thioredoxin
MRLTITISILAITFLLVGVPTRAQETAVVQVVFFFNPECDNCQKVMTEDLPPLQAKYGAQLEIIQVDTSMTEGIKLYQAMSRNFHLTNDRLGTPAIVIDTTVLVGADEIPAKLPGMIEEGIAKGGINWPDIPGLESFITSTMETNPYPASQVYPQPAAQMTGTEESADKSTWERFSSNFNKDPIANSLAVITLVGMVLSIFIALIILFRSVLAENPTPVTIHISTWLIPLLIIIGLGVAGYLTYIEVGEKQAICGPVGHCNEVQNSSYAKLFGILPIGVLGLIGYTALLAVWGVLKIGPKSLRMLSALALWGVSLFGVAFSIYLTFLEPFVIGATCMWCLSSALVMTALLWVTTPLIQETFATEDNDDGD